MHDLRIFASALAGDDAELTAVAGADGVVCVAPELHSVFLVEAAPDGTHKATVAVVGSYGGGSVNLVPIPKAFRVQRIESDGERFVVAAADGRTVHGTPSQFAHWVKILDEEHNPDYETHLEEAFLATPSLPEDSPEPEQLATDIEVSFDSAGPETVTALLPHARTLAAALDRIAQAGAEFLWTWGAKGDESEAEKAEFFDQVMPPTDLVVYRSGDFELHYCNASGGDHFMEGYWPAILFRADQTPVAVSVEA